MNLGNTHRPNDSESVPYSIEINPEIYIPDDANSAPGAITLENLSVKEIKTFLARLENPSITRNTILGNGWTAGEFAIAYLRLVWKRKRDRRPYVPKTDTRTFNHVRIA